VEDFEGGRAAMRERLGGGSVRRESEIRRDAVAQVEREGHTYTVDRAGRIWVCSDPCTEFRALYPRASEAHPGIRTRLAEIEQLADPAEKAARVADLGAEINRARGSLSPQVWDRLQAERASGGRNMPLRSVHPDDAQTLALLQADDTEFIGVNSGSQPAEAPRLDNPYGGVGAVTPTHAEGDALNQLARSRGTTPVAGSPWGSTGGRRGGSAVMYVDRDPCPYYCGAYGVQRMRQAAGLDELFVHSPGGVRRFADSTPLGGTLVPAGTP
jgi:hypothetical protein